VRRWGLGPPAGEQQSGKQQTELWRGSGALGGVGFRTTEAMESEFFSFCFQRGGKTVADSVQ